MGPCTANARRPTVDSRCRGTTISFCVADLRRCNHANQLSLKCHKYPKGHFKDTVQNVTKHGLKHAVKNKN